MEVMNPFKPVVVTSQNELKKYFSFDKSHLCDYTFGNAYMWRNDLSSSYLIVSNTLLFRKEYKKGYYAYLYPLGENVESALCYLENYAFIHHETLSFFALNEDEANALSARYKHRRLVTSESWSDYFYLANELKNYPGKKFEGKRHNAARFHRLHPDVSIKKAELSDQSRLVDFLKKYQKENADKDVSLEELRLTHEMIVNFDTLGETLGYYEKDGQIIGFSCGEEKNDTVYVHIEKAFRDFSGIYQALTQDYLRFFFPQALYENREEDDGNPGLKEAKEQLHPVAKLAKYFLTVTNPIDLLQKPYDIKGKELSLCLLTQKDAETYAKMATDESLNRYWGYDYKKDLLSNVKPTASYFYQDVHHDYETKDCYSFVIKNAVFAFVGEAVLYHFSDDGEAEIGIRILKNYQHQGYARKAVSLLINEAKKIGFSKLRYECYKENEYSILLAASLGFAKTGENAEKTFFELLLNS